MPKPSGSKGGGGGGANLFTDSVLGPPPGPLTADKDDWIELGVIPTGSAIWFGSAQYASIDKSITFEIRYNNSGESAGSEGTTTKLAATSVSPRKGMVTADYYKKGRLHLVSLIGTGIEKFWLRLKAKQQTAGEYFYIVNYTVE